MDSCVKMAYAKINLGLDVVGVLPNRYHEVRMIMQTVDIKDELTFEKTDGEIVITTDCGELPTDEDNLIYKAVAQMKEAYGFTGGVRVHLKKKIPVAAGMAGGSSDAAAALKGVNELYRLGASPEDLQKIGIRIGADVPYCIMGGTALAEGIGEKLTALPDAPDCVLLVVKPDLNVSTKEVYGRLDAREGYAHPDIDGMIQAIRQQDIGAVAALLMNVLEPVTEEICPEIAEIKRIMQENGALGSLMSGSGPTVFGIYRDRETAEAAQRKLTGDERLHLKQSFVTRFVRS